MIPDQKVKVKWGNRNASYYISLGYPKLKIGEEFEVDIKHLLPNSPSEVKLICDYCGTEFTNLYKSISKSKNHFCTKACHNAFMTGKSNPRVERIKLSCDYCGCEIERTEAEMKGHKNFFCSHKCANEFMKGKEKGNKVERIKLNCSYCNKEIERTEAELKRAKNHFCSKKCADNFMKGKENKTLQKREKVNCYMCGKEFKLPLYRIKGSERHFCSKDCHTAWKKSDEFKQIRKTENGTVKTNCFYCGKEIIRKRSEYEKQERHFCSRSCLGKYKFKYNNPNPKKAKIPVKCNYCGKEFKVHESKIKSNKWLFCSRDCYATFRSENLVGEEVYNYNRINKKCDNCGTNVKVTPYYLNNRKNVFCSQNCYYEFRSKYYIGENHPQYGIQKTPEQIEKMRQITAKRIANGDFKQTNTTIHNKIKDLLSYLNINFIEEYYCKYYVVDFYLPDFNLMIEVMGDYWHANPIKYNDYNKLHKIQKKDVKRDKSKNTYIKKYYNIDILYLWETDINNSLYKCRELIKLYINNKGKLSDYNSFNYKLVNGKLIINNDIIMPYFLKANNVS